MYTCKYHYHPSMDLFSGKTLGTFARPECHFWLNAPLVLHCPKFWSFCSRPDRLQLLPCSAHAHAHVIAIVIGSTKSVVHCMATVWHMSGLCKFALLHSCMAARRQGCTAAWLQSCLSWYCCTGARVHGSMAARLHSCTAVWLHG